MGVENRTLDDKVSTLIKHIEGGIACIERGIESGLLKPELGQALLNHNRVELEQLRGLPPDARLRDVLANHWEKKKEENDLFPSK